MVVVVVAAAAFGCYQCILDWLSVPELTNGCICDRVFHHRETAFVHWHVRKDCRPHLKPRIKRSSPIKTGVVEGEMNDFHHTDRGRRIVHYVFGTHGGVPRRLVRGCRIWGLVVEEGHDGLVGRLTTK